MTSDVLRQGTVAVARDFAAPRPLVYEAWTALAHRRNWFAGFEWTEIDRHVDLRVGGGELAHGHFPDGTETIYCSRFHLVEPPRRLIYAFDMHVGGAYFSTSLVAAELTEIERGTRLAYTEHGIYLDPGYDDTQRRAGTEWLLEQFSAYLDTLS